jgi:hypothetical protein
MLDDGTIILGNYCDMQISRMPVSGTKYVWREPYRDSIYRDVVFETII